MGAGAYTASNWGSGVKYPKAESFLSLEHPKERQMYSLLCSVQTAKIQQNGPGYAASVSRNFSKKCFKGRNATTVADTQHSYDLTLASPRWW